MQPHGRSSTWRSAARLVDVDAVPSLLAVGFAFAMSLLTGIVFGVAPAIVGSRSAPIEAMRGAGRVAGERATRLRQSLIALQVAMSLVLITSAGLLAQPAEARSAGFGSRWRGAT